MGGYQFHAVFPHRADVVSRFVPVDLAADGTWDAVFGNQNVLLLRTEPETLDLELVNPSQLGNEFVEASSLADWDLAALTADAAASFVFSNATLQVFAHLPSASDGRYDTAAVLVGTASESLSNLCLCDIGQTGAASVFASGSTSGVLFGTTPALTVSTGVDFVQVFNAFAVTDCRCTDWELNDGRNELVVYGEGVAVLVFSAGGTNTELAAPRVIHLLVDGINVKDVRIIDTDADSDLDLVVQRADWTIFIHSQATSGAFFSSYEITAVLTVATDLRMFAIANVNADALPDFAVAYDMSMALLVTTSVCSADVTQLAGGNVTVVDASGAVKVAPFSSGDFATFACSNSGILFGVTNATCAASGLWSGDALCAPAGAQTEIRCVSGCAIPAAGATTARQTQVGVAMRGSAAKLRASATDPNIHCVVLTSAFFGLQRNKPWIVTINGQAVDFTISGDEITLFVPLSLLAGAAVGSPVALSISNERFQYAPDLSSLLYVEAASAADCLLEGLWFLNGQCLVCPEGAFCPGGSRIWPRAGYWSPNELIRPVKCTIERACCGAIGERNDVCPVAVTAANTRATARCDETAGFTGELCERCLPGYFRDTAQCRRCESRSTGSGEFAALVLAAIIVLVVFSVGLALAPTHVFVLVLSVVMLLQSFVLLGRQVSARVSGRAGERLSDAFRLMSIALLDVEFFKPGCFVSAQITYVDLLYGQAALTALAATASVVASLVYAALRMLCERRKRAPSGGKSGAKAKGDGKRAETPKHDGRVADESDVDSDDESMRSASENESTGVRRFLLLALSRAKLGLFSLAMFLLQINAVRAFQGVACTREFGKWRLLAERTTVCYRGDHKSASALIWVLLVTSIALPLVCGALIFYLHVNKTSMLAMMTREALAFLLRAVRPSTKWFRVISLVMTVVLAGVLTNIASSAVRIFVGTLAVLVNGSLVVAFLPFRKWTQNAIPPISALLTGVQVVVILFIGEAAEGTSRLRAALIALVAVFFIACAVRVGLLVLARARGDRSSASGQLTVSSGSASSSGRTDETDTDADTDASDPTDTTDAFSASSN